MKALTGDASGPEIAQYGLDAGPSNIYDSYDTIPAVSEREKLMYFSTVSRMDRPEARSGKGSVSVLIKLVLFT